MRRLLSILALMLGPSAGATHWLTYYVYIETEYVQGPWSRMDLLEGFEHRHLAPHAYEDLFGSEAEDLVGKMLSRLREKKPEMYAWAYDLIVQGDTVVLTPNGPIGEPGTVKNEITATLTLNGFKAVVFHLVDGPETLTIDDLTLPYFDIVVAERNTPEATGPSTIGTQGTTQQQGSEGTSDKGSGSWTGWLIVSVAMNIVLLGLLIIRKRDRTAGANKGLDL